MDIGFFTRQAFGQAARFSPDLPSIAYDDGEYISYGTLEDRVARYAAALEDIGVGPGDRVALLLYNCTEYWISYFAVTQLGAIAVRLNFRLAADELQYALVDSGSKIVLGHTDLIARLDEVRASLDVRTYVSLKAPGETSHERPRGATIDWAVLEDAEPKRSPDRPLPTADTPAMLMYTSGTTGKPKGALWSHGTTTWWAAMQIMEWRLDRSSVTMVTGPMYHIGALENYALPTLAAGGRVVVLRSRNFDIAQTLAIASKQRVTDILLFPSMIYQMLESKGIEALDLSTIRRVFSGGDPLLPSAIERMRDRFGWMDIVQVYGLTEGTPIVACGAPGQSRARPEVVGRAFPFAELSVRNDDGARLPDGESGEIWTRSPANALGYWQKPEITKQTFIDGWCRTGDLGVIDNGALRVSGRKKDMIRSGGENIHASEIENVLLRHDGIADAAVIGIPDPLYTETVCAVVVLAKGASLTAEEVVAHCSTSLASFKKPRKVVFVDELPRTASQKVLKYQLRERFSESGDRSA
jgi:fatty-acyl-CoA synthase